MASGAGGSHGFWRGRGRSLRKRRAPAWPARARLERTPGLGRSIPVRPLLLLVAACSARSAPPPAVAQPTPVPDPYALGAKCPVGDSVHVSVYGFLERELEEAAAEDGGRAETRAVLAREAELLKQPDMKPQRASILERELSHVLEGLCRGAPGCKAIGLYNKSGLAIALSSIGDAIAPLGFDDARWAALTAVPADGAKLAITAAEAERLPADRHALVVFPARHGLALCIIEE
jgi:hypothetical protein